MRKKIVRSFCLLFCFVLTVGCITPLGLRVHADGEGDITVTVDGGTAVFVGKNADFAGKAAEGDVLFVSLTEQNNRVFKYWATPSGTMIEDAEFSMMVGAEEHLFAVFADTDDYEFGAWTLVRDGNCTEGKLYRATNTVGDVKYKLEYVNDGHHSFPDHSEYVDEEIHRMVCSVCGYTVEEEHYYSDCSVEREPTHMLSGLQVSYCYGCQHRIETVLPRTDEHVFDGTWTIVEPSVNGQYGKRMRKCKYCDYTETYWYLDLDLKSILKDKYLNFVMTNSGTTTHDEQYYMFTREDGCDVYIFATQYQYTYGGTRDNDQTWIFMYIDDHVDGNLDPVYLTKSSRSGGGRGEIKWAKYGYVYGADGWIKYLDGLDYMFGNCRDIGASNTMSARDSTLASFGRRWVDTYNEFMIPVTKDPDSYLVAYGSQSGWYVVESNGEPVENFNVGGYWYDAVDGYIGGFTNTVELRRLVSGDGSYYSPYKYEVVVLDRDSGLTLNMTQEVSNMRFYTYRYLDVVADDAYELLDEGEKSGCVPVGEIAERLRGFSGSNARNQITAPFTLDEPEDMKAVRLICYKDYIGDQWDQYTNDGRLFYVTKSEQNSYPITLTWNAENNPGNTFDGWYMWDFASGKWQLISTATSFDVNTVAAPFTDLTIITAKYHYVPVAVSVTVENGYYTVDGDNTHYTGGQVECGTVINLFPDTSGNMQLDEWTTSTGDTYYYTEPSISVTEDVTIVAHLSKQTAGVNVCTYDGIGNVWAVGYEGEKDTYINRQGDVGSVITFRSEGDGDFDTFLGWYMRYYGKSGESYVFLSAEDEYEYTVAAYPEFECIVAVWSDGTVSLEPKRLNVRVEGGFALLPNNGGKGGFGVGGIRGNAFNRLSVTGNTELMLLDDPNDTLVVSLWTVVYNAYGEEREDPINVNYEYDTRVFIFDASSYTERTIVILSNGLTKCADDAHVWDAGTQLSEASHAYDGKIRYICSVCGDVKYEVIPRLDHEIIHVEAVPATCTTAGNRGYYRCDTCGEWYSDSAGMNVIGDHSTVQLPAIGHTPGEPAHENEVAATNNSDGSYDLVTRCSVCGTVLSSEHKTVPAPSHMPGDINGDGELNIKDLITLAQYHADWGIPVVEAALDTNGDGVLNVKDVIHLAQYLADWQVVLV